MLRSDKIVTFYRPEQTVAAEVGFSRSPQKPALLLEEIRARELESHFSLNTSFSPLKPEEFLPAHTKEYVESFFSGKKPLCESNLLEWSEQFAESIKYTNSSLMHAVMHALQNPAEIVFSPTSGFHHARPERGRGFCTFSGQVLASLNALRMKGARGAYLDLDKHFGNSIEDTREFAPDLNLAVPPGFNINPLGNHTFYIEDFLDKLRKLEANLIEGSINYLVFCHGADSHEDDDTRGQCTTEEWLKCSRIFYSWIAEMDKKLGAPVPLVITLFGGYRSDDYSSVLSLHLADLVECLNTLCSQRISYQPNILPRY